MTPVINQWSNPIQYLYKQIYPTILLLFHLRKQFGSKIEIYHHFAKKDASSKRASLNILEEKKRDLWDRIIIGNVN